MKNSESGTQLTVEQEERRWELLDDLDDIANRIVMCEHEISWSLCPERRAHARFQLGQLEIKRVQLMVDIDALGGIALP